MTTYAPLDPHQRIESLDILRGFALMGIIFNNMQYLSGYAFTPFAMLRQMMDFPLNEGFYHSLDIVITAKFYTLFSFLFAAGFFIQLSKHTDDRTEFLKVYRRRLYVLLALGVVHSLIWFGDILLSYALVGFLLVLFRNAKPRNLLRWSLAILLLPYLIDMVLMPFFPASGTPGINTMPPVVHVSYPDMTPETVLTTFQNGSVGDLFLLNLHCLVWKYLGYLPSGQYFTLTGIFILGFYLASTGFYAKAPMPASRFIIMVIVGVLATVAARSLGGSPYRWPPTIHNIFFKSLLTMGQIFMCLSYMAFIFKMLQTELGKKLLKYLIPMGRMALTNYLSQTIILIVLFYSCGLDLFGKLSLIQTAGIVMVILTLQIVASNVWLRHFRFGPCEWLWRSLTYRTWMPWALNG